MRNVITWQREPSYYNSKPMNSNKSAIALLPFFAFSVYALCERVYIRAIWKGKQYMLFDGSAFAHNTRYAWRAMEYVRSYSSYVFAVKTNENTMRSRRKRGERWQRTNMADDRKGESKILIGGQRK